MKVVITEPEYFPSELVKELEEFCEVVSKRMSKDELKEQTKDADALLIRVETAVDSYVLEGAQKLKMIGSMTTGLDHIDKEKCKEMGVDVINFPGYATTAAAEYVMGLIMSLSRRIPWAFDDFKNGKWERFKFTGPELKGKTLGVVGFGRIGYDVGKYANAFGMKVVFMDPYVREEVLEDIKNGKIDAERTESLDYLLEKSDYITLHTFLSKETENMINKEAFQKMKKTSFIVNASRGKVIDEDALIEALENGEIAGAALDVFSQEPFPSSGRLIDYAKSHDNLILTPHIAGSTNESVHSGAGFMVDKIKEIAGRTVKSLPGQE